MTRRLAIVVMATALFALAAGSFGEVRDDPAPTGSDAVISASAAGAHGATVVTRRAPTAVRTGHPRLLRSTALAACAVLLVGLARATRPGRHRKRVDAGRPARVLHRHSIALRAPPVLQLIPA